MNRAHRRRRKKKRGQGEVELNLAAMLDMAFQLLTFFIMTFKPAPTEGQISVLMPPPHPTVIQKDGQKAGSSADNKSPVQGLETLTVTVEGNEQGQITRLMVAKSGLGTNFVALQNMMQKYLGDASNGFQQVVVQVEDVVTYGELMKVMEVTSKITMPNNKPLDRISYVALPKGKK